MSINSINRNLSEINASDDISNDGNDKDNKVFPKIHSKNHLNYSKILTPTNAENETGSDAKNKIQTNDIFSNLKKNHKKFVCNEDQKLQRKLDGLVNGLDELSICLYRLKVSLGRADALLASLQTDDSDEIKKINDNIDCSFKFGQSLSDNLYKLKLNIGKIKNDELRFELENYINDSIKAYKNSFKRFDSTCPKIKKSETSSVVISSSSSDFSQSLFSENENFDSANESGD